MGEVLKIFISATSADLKAARERARDFFNQQDHYKAREQKHRSSVPATLLVNDRHHLADCDAVLHIVGECYGQEPRAMDGPRRSYTQSEHDWAIAHQKPLYIFVCEDGFPYKKHKPESQVKQDLQRAHRAAILTGDHKYGDHKYQLIADLAGLDRCLREIQLPLQQLEQQLRRTRKRDVLVGSQLRELAGKVTAIDPLQRYYQNLREQFANYDNVGLPVAAREGKEEEEKPIKIRDLFVPPHCSEQHIRPAELDAAVREGHSIGQPLLPLLGERGARILLLADPGMGKSTVIQLLIATLADNDTPAGAPGLRGSVPFPFILRELVRLLPVDVKKWNWRALVNAFCRWNPRGSGGPALAAPLAEDQALFWSLIGSNDSFFLIDGLDEIGDLASRVAIRNAIWEGLTQYRNARWLITSRIVGYERAHLHISPVLSDRSAEEVQREAKERGAASVILEAFSEKEHRWLGNYIWAFPYYLAPFNDTQQRAFAEHWYLPRMGEDKGIQRAEEFIAAVHQHPHTRVIGRIPNLLYLLALLYRHQAQLPHGRALVYEAISEAYLDSIPLQRLLLGEAAAYSQSFPVKEQLLAVVGMKMQQMRASRKKGEDGDILVSREQLGEWLGGRFESPAALQEFLDHVARHSGLLLPRGEGVYGFAHLSFQEYYAACHLRSDFERIVTAKARPASGFLRRAAPSAHEHEERLFAEYAKQTVWHEPLLFLVEKFRGSPDYTEQLLNWMFPQLAGDPAKGKDWMPIAAAQLLAKLSIDPEVALELSQRVDLWQALWKVDWAAWTNEWRIAPSLVVAESVFQAGVLQAAALLVPQRLYLSNCTGLSDISPLAGLTGLTQLSLSHCTALGDLTPLTGLSSLRRLSLFECTALRDLTPLAGLTGLQSLDLDGCTGLDEFTSLAGLAGLQRLNLSRCPALRVLTQLAGLPDVRELYLSDCMALGELTPLGGLTGLQILSLIGCPGVDDLTPLAGLTGLELLYLSGCTGLGDLTPLAGLTGLQRLDLDGCTGLRDLTPLAGLTGLQTLDLRGCTGLGEADVAKLRQTLPHCEIRW